MFDDLGFDFTYCANANKCGKREQCYRGRGPDKDRDAQDVAVQAKWSNFYWAGDADGECDMLVPYNASNEGPALATVPLD